MLWDPADPFFSNRRPVRPAVLVAARAIHPWLDPDYWALQQRIGYGEFGGLMFYEGPATGESLGVEGAPGGFVAVADDLAGCLYGFHPSHGGKVVAVDSHGWSMDPVSPSFAEFVAGLRQAHG